jgi:uncharacterized protein with FMN-binding domain
MEIKIKLAEKIKPPKSDAVRKAFQRIGISFSEEKDGNYIVTTEGYFAEMIKMELRKDGVIVTNKTLSEAIRRAIAERQVEVYSSEDHK